jgi:ABC-type amino acid transport substrate-binding protein
MYTDVHWRSKPLDAANTGSSLKGTMAMMKRSRLITAFAVLALIAVTAACSSSGSSTGASTSKSKTNSLGLVTPGVLTVAVYGTAPPYLTINASGTQFGGVDGNLIEGFAKSLGLNVKVFQTTFASSILAVEQHKADMGTYIFYTPQRAANIYYTLPFMTDHAVVFTLKNFPYKSTASLNGKSVGTVVGYVWAPYLQKDFGSSAHLYPDLVTVGTALLNGQIQGYVNGASTALTPPLNTPKVVPHVLAAGDWGFPASLIQTLAYNDVNCKDKPLAIALDKYELSLSKSGKYTSMVNAQVAAIETSMHVKLPSLVPALTEPHNVC